MPPPVPPLPPTYTSVNHLLHLVLVLLTCGLWIFGWPIAYAITTSANNTKRRQYEQAYRQYQHQLWAYEQSRR